MGLGFLVLDFSFNGLDFIPDLVGAIFFILGAGNLLGAGRRAVALRVLLGLLAALEGLRLLASQEVIGLVDFDFALGWVYTPVLTLSVWLMCGVAMELGARVERSGAANRLSIFRLLVATGNVVGLVLLRDEGAFQMYVADLEAGVSVGVFFTLAWIGLCAIAIQLWLLSSVFDEPGRESRGAVGSARGPLPAIVAVATFALICASVPIWLFVYDAGPKTATVVHWRLLDSASRPMSWTGDVRPGRVLCTDEDPCDRALNYPQDCDLELTIRPSSGERPWIVRRADRRVDIEYEARFYYSSPAPSGEPVRTWEGASFVEMETWWRARGAEFTMDFELDCVPDRMDMAFELDLSDLEEQLLDVSFVGDGG